jgi:hypothetical protein
VKGRALTAEIGLVESALPRVASLRIVLREFLHALDTGNEVVAQMLERCTLGSPAGSAVLLIPLARLPVKDRQSTLER